MGECNIGIGPCSDREWREDDLALDVKYSIRVVESSDDATIALEGYVDSSVIDDDIEVFHTQPKIPGHPKTRH